MFTADHSVLCILVKGVEPNCFCTTQRHCYSIRVYTGLYRLTLCNIRFQHCSTNTKVNSQVIILLLFHFKIKNSQKMAALYFRTAFLDLHCIFTIRY